jgi:predicted enzyme related to lactoylglutathione lyase
VVEPKAEVPGQGWYGVFRDPEGNELAVWESLPRG